LIEIGLLVLEKKALVILIIFHSCFYLHLEKDVSLHLKNLDYPLPLKLLLPILVKIGPVILEKNSKMRKSLQMDGQIARRTSGDQKYQVS
jgi:hypothetical protein